MRRPADGILWLDPTGVFKQLSAIPVTSAYDGTDGAHDLVVFEQDVLIANCESALLRGHWEDDAVELSGVRGPWSPDYGYCSPSRVELAGDVRVLVGSRLGFARICE